MILFQFKVRVDPLGQASRLVIVISIDKIVNVMTDWPALGWDSSTLILDRSEPDPSSHKRKAEERSKISFGISFSV